ncbi:polycystin-2-like protein 1 isoform X3 [Musca domestica]|uniref:Polycystin-2-like protein 1 isoform X3 n=1 Tax=Musca domestica TaxID=7370 RepID=A0ABM3VAF8_MUSDO|nr:polycystin-2-like protein 1 isoform X3 [Musca domestica]XP_058982758.1 polycystin-2-like protein 1 isoform X3 [Musca domestica]
MFFPRIFLQKFRIKDKKSTKRGIKTTTVKYDTDESVRSALLEILIYVIFLITTTIVATASRHLYMFYLNQTLEKLFTGREMETNYGVEVRFEELVTTADWWSFLQYKFLDDLHGEMLSSTENETFSLNNKTNGKDGLAKWQRVVLKDNILLGPPRLRQIRVKENTCHVNEAFVRYFNSCYGEYDRKIEDRSPVYKNTKFYTVSQLNVNPIRGEIKRYYGAGHVQNLSYERMINEEIFETLKSSKWIDRGTRIVVVEFVLFNYNSLMFDNVKILAELPPVGGIVTSHQFQAVKLHSIWSDADYSVFIAAIIFYLMTTFYTFEEIGELITIGSVKYLKSVWNLLDISVLLMSYLSLIYNMFHHKYLNGILEKSKENPNHFWSIDKICFWNLLYIDMMGICVFLVWIKIFKYISINKTMLQFSTTLKRCAKDLCGFAVMFFIVFLAYAQLGLLIFGTSHPDFREFGISIITLMRMFLGDFEYELIEEANHILGPIYFLSYVLFVFFILLNMFLAIINDTYGTVKDEVNQGYSKFGPYLAKILQKCFWWRKKDPEHNILKHTNDSKGQLSLKDSNGHSSDTFYPMTNEGSLPEDDTLRLRINISNICLLMKIVCNVFT